MTTTPKVDSTTKNAAVKILIAFDLLFFAVTLALYVFAIHWPVLKDLADKVWTVFMAANGSVGLALSLDSKRSDRSDDSSAADGSPANPTK